MRELNDVDNSNIAHRLEAGNEESNAQEPKAEDGENNILEDEMLMNALRHGFIRKVYGILSAQLLITTLIICLSFIPVIKEALTNSVIPMIFAWVSLVLLVIIICVFICGSNMARRVPHNYILLGLFTLAESYCLMIISCTYDSEIVLFALIGTTGITITLTIYAYFTKTNFTLLGKMLSVCLFLMMFGFIDVIFFWNYDYWNFFYSICGLFIYALYLIFDTQLIFGKFGVQYQSDDYILAAMNLYLDIIQIFLRLLRSLNASRNRS